MYLFNLFRNESELNAYFCLLNITSEMNNVKHTIQLPHFTNIKNKRFYTYMNYFMIKLQMRDDIIIYDSKQNENKFINQVIFCLKVYSLTLTFLMEAFPIQFSVIFVSLNR